MSEKCKTCGTVKYFDDDKRQWICWPCDNKVVKRYEIFDGKHGQGFDLVERDTGEWVRAEDYDALAERVADLELTIDRLLLLQRLGRSIEVKEVIDEDRG